MSAGAADALSEAAGVTEGGGFSKVIINTNHRLQSAFADGDEREDIMEQPEQQCREACVDIHGLQSGVSAIVEFPLPSSNSWILS
jgi:hypothetical protein